MIKNLEKKLKKYCAKNGLRPELQAPFYQDKKIRATNAYIAVSIPSDNINSVVYPFGYVVRETPQIDAIKRPDKITIKLSVKRLKDALTIFNDKIMDDIILTVGEINDPVMIYQKEIGAEVLIMPIIN